MFEQLTEELPAPELLTFEGLRGEYIQDPFAFVWSTEVPDVTNPWPTIEDPGPASIRDAIQMLTGRTDVTGYLYTLKDLEAYSPAARVRMCTQCQKPECRDKWCGLRGDEEDGHPGHELPGAEPGGTEPDPGSDQDA